MKIRYTVTADDVGAMATYYYGHSASARQPFVIFQWVGALAAAGIAYLIIGLFPRLEDFRIVLTIVAFFVFAATFWGSLGPATRSYTRNYLSKESSRGILGEHELEIGEGALIERTTYNEMRVSWNGIERVVEETDHVYVFLNSFTAHIIPRNGILEGNLSHFITELKKRVPQEALLVSSDR